MERPGPSRGGWLFAATMFTLTHAWLVIVRTLPSSPAALLSYALEQLIVWGLVLALDQRLSRRSQRFTLAAGASLWVCYTLVSALLLRMTSLAVPELLPMLLASEHVLQGLREIGLGPARLLILFGAVAAASLVGGLLRLRLEDAPAPLRPPRLHGSLFAALCLVVPVAFVLEQAHARDSDEYLHRALNMPGYLQLYGTSSSSVVLPMLRPVDHGVRVAWLAQIGPAKHPRHVLYVLLESFRADTVRPNVTPNLWRLSEQGQTFDAALAEATHTPLSWSVLLFDEAPQDNVFGRFPGRAQPLGSWLLAVMRKAGYELHVSVSTNLDYGGVRKRLRGSGVAAFDLFQAAERTAGNPFDKNRNDALSADHLVRFIEQHAWQRAGQAPQFLLLQLDSTHYTYPFPKHQALFAPYSEDLVLPKPIETRAEATLLRNRYWNAAHYVDEQLGRVLAALRAAGVYDDTLVVVTSDHGEGLSPGRQGHGPIFEASKRVPLIFEVPGVAAARSSQLISHRDILPTLAEHLGIALPRGSTRGCSATLGPAPAVLTLGPTGHFGQLTSSDQEVDVQLLFTPQSVTVTPTALTCPGPCDVTPRAQQRWIAALASALRADRGRRGCTGDDHALELVSTR